MPALRLAVAAPGQAGGVPADDERVRAAIESSAALGAGMRAINALLGVLGAGDTLKAHFEVRTPARLVVPVDAGH